MRLGLMLGYAAGKIELPIELVQEADRLGVEVVWTAEAYGSDAVSPLAWLGALTEKVKLGTAIMQIPGRTPANAAMTAMTLNQLSNGRFVMGLGMSGPQVVEGWHGVSYQKPLARTREYVEILRAVFQRKKPLTYDGQFYKLPLSGSGSTGLGKPLKSTLRAAGEIPIYLAAIGPKNVALAAEIADGWLPIFFAPEKFDSIFKPSLQNGLARSQRNKNISDIDIAPMVSVVIDDDLERAYNSLRPLLALYVGGMGARSRNFYAELASRYGYESETMKIQDLYLDGRRGEAMMAVPKELIDDVALVGPVERIRDRLSLWKDSPIKTLNLTVPDIETLRTVVELAG